MNNTLVKGLQLLEVLARSEGALGVSELANRLALGKSNVHRLLQALVELGYVQKNEQRGTYQASLKLWEIGTAMASRLGIKTHALDAMERLLQTTRETVHLSVLDGDEVVYVHKIDSPEPVRAYSEIGGRVPAWCVATGKAIYEGQRIELGSYSSSPLLADGKVYAINEEGTTTVIKAGPVFEVLGVNKLDGYTLASPVAAGNQLFIRTGEALYCIGRK